MNDTTWQRRAEAAEKTVTVLKTKVRALYNGDRGTVQKQLERAKEREERSRARRAVMEAKTAALEEHSARLEEEVAQRTKDIQTILDHVTFGFLIIDREAKVREGYTRSCMELLGCDDITGHPLPAVLGLPEEGSAWQHYLLSVDEVYEDIMPEELTLAQLPGRFAMSDDRVVRVEGRTIRDEQGEIEGLLMTISDITQLEAAQREGQVNRALIRILKQRDAFRDFLLDCRVQLQAARGAVDANAVFVRRVVHTIKGNAASFGLDSVARCVHEVEERDAVDRAGLDEIEAALVGFLEDHAEVLEVDYASLGSEDRYEVDGDRLAQLRQIVDEANRPDLRTWTAELQQKPAARLLGPVEAFVDRLAERLEKEVHFELAGVDTPVDCETVRPIFRNLTHLLRNALDHGIEPSWSRGDKPAVPTVRLAIESNDEAWQIIVEDDGRGIDTARITQRAVESGVIDAAQAAAMDEAARRDLIFKDGLSSSAEATEISGRGVGMSAVRAAVRGAGGHISVHSEAGTGTRFVLHVPRPRVAATA